MIGQDLVDDATCEGGVLWIAVKRTDEYFHGLPDRPAAAPGPGRPVHGQPFGEDLVGTLSVAAAEASGLQTDGHRLPLPRQITQRARVSTVTGNHGTRTSRTARGLIDPDQKHHALFGLLHFFQDERIRLR